MANPAQVERREAVNELKRSLIIDAARRVFEAEGLDGASMRVIAREAGYTPGAIYFHFPGKEAIYGAVLQELLERLVSRVDAALAPLSGPSDRARASALAFYDFFAENPRDLDFGFYLFKSGIRPRGLTKELNAELNQRLADSLAPIGAAVRETGGSEEAAQALMADVFAHAVGLLILKHTRRIRIFGCAPRELMEQYMDTALLQMDEIK